MSIELVLLSNYLILCASLLLLHSVFPSIRVFTSESVLHIRWPNIGASASASVLPVNIQSWFPLGINWFDLLEVQGLSRFFSSNAVQKHQFFSAQLSLWSISHICTWLLEKPLLLLFSHSVMCDSLQAHGLQPTRLLHPWDLTVDSVLKSRDITLLAKDHLVKTSFSSSHVLM